MHASYIGSILTNEVFIWETVRIIIVYLFLFIRVISLKVLERYILLEKLYALTEKFNTPINGGISERGHKCENSLLSQR